MVAKETDVKRKRVFNVEGPNDPRKHFTVIRTELLEKGRQMVLEGRFFSLFAPRQTGKTTYFKLLIERLREEKTLLPVWLSLENYQYVKSIKELLETFQYEFETELAQAEVVYQGKPLKTVTGLPRYFAGLRAATPRKLLLVLDEFDSLPERYVGMILHTFRKMYHKRENYPLQSVILVGIRNLTGVNLDHASPFNIAAELELTWFSKEEVCELMGQYEKETGQLFAPAVKERLYYETQGQPGLVNELCQILVERFNPEDPAKLYQGERASKEIGLDAFEAMLNYYVTKHISRNVSNIMSKAQEHEQEILRLFDTGRKTVFMVDEPWQKYLYANGVINAEEDPVSRQNYVKFTCPVYQKKLYAFFKPKLQAEERNYLLPGEDYRQYLRPEGGLDLLAALKNYQRYVNRRGSKAFNFAPKRQDGTRYEAVYHFSLDAYLASLADRLGGTSNVEFPTGNGKVDIWLQVNRRRYVIEIKNYVDETMLAKAKLQAARYARSEGLDEAYLVVFTEVHGPKFSEFTFQEEIEGVRLYGFFINVAFRPGQGQKRKANEHRRNAE